ncbi:substrate-binding domain-containing protein [Pseudomonas cerasi]|uniref:ABC transporter substrate-binding protein n=1 Tax=Pseudomonas cerasi TaxID=1583341 RepID=A0A193SSH3_9PSED|nr:substrate-binding domain-containing protein [Pseudomonas cerasi]CZT30141.1 hypothetical protein PCPL58_3685 [Pseudomonas cerasi]SOS21862.1 hypothetical protein PL963_03775 [Pseudomonas cerasi]
MKPTIFCAVLSLLVSADALAGELKVLTTGAFKPVLMALAPELEASRHITLTISNGTAGELAKRIDAGEHFDVAILTDSLVRQYQASGAMAQDWAKNVAKVGIGVAVPLNAPKPGIATVEQFKSMLGSQAMIAYIDPRSGGSSGVYLSQLFDRLGGAEAVAKKSVLVNGGLVGTTLIDGRASVAIHQISELLAVSGIQYVGPLPAEIQRYTLYTSAVGSQSVDVEDSREVIRALSGQKAVELLRAKGMESVQAQ